MKIASVESVRGARFRFNLFRHFSRNFGSQKDDVPPKIARNAGSNPSDDDDDGEEENFISRYFYTAILKIKINIFNGRLRRHNFVFGRCERFFKIRREKFGGKS